MAQTLILLQEKDLLNEDALNQRIAELETKYHDALAVVKDLEGRMKTNKELRYHVAAYASTKTIAQQLKTAKRPAAFEEQHRAELTAYRVAAAYFKANNLTKLPLSLIHISDFSSPSLLITISENDGSGSFSVKPRHCEV